jgi:hypothetical protein
MNPPRSTAEDYIQFLASSPRAFSCAEAGRVQPRCPLAAHHDSFNRLLHRLDPEPEILWEEAQSPVVRNQGVLVLDDSTLDKPSAHKIDLVTNHWSGKHKAVVRGINLITLLWTDGDRKIPCDYRAFDSGFVRIRHYGLLANRHRHEKLAWCRQLLGSGPAAEADSPETVKLPERPTTITPTRVCPVCGAGRMRLLGQRPRSQGAPRRGPIA